MRLTPEQIQSTTQTISRSTGNGADVYLFGLRLNDKARGDVDLLIETNAPLTLVQRAQIKLELEFQLELPIDIVSQTRNAAPTLFQATARENAKQLLT